ncbi:MAG: CARDB domain-containing protein [Thermoleophilia bacterium]
MQVSFFEDEEEERIEEEEVTEVRRPKRGGGKRRPPAQSPLVKVLIILVAVVVLVLIVSLGIKSCINSKKVSEYRDYFAAVEKVAADSDDIGKQLSGMFQKPDAQVRASMEGKLTEFQNASNQLLDQAKAIKPPDIFKSENEWFVASMQIRARGLKGLQPAILNALEARDNQAGAAQVAHEMLILLTSDVAYDEFFYQPAQRVLQDEDVKDIKVPQAKFLTDSALASQQTVVAVLEQLKGGTAQVSGLHGVALAGIKLQPSGMALVANSDNSTKASDSLTFQVEVENQGEATESEVLVSLNMTAPGQPAPQKVDGRIPTIAPGERKTIELTGLAAQAGTQYLLRVEVGPVLGEVNTQNNIGEYRISFS